MSPAAVDLYALPHVYDVLHAPGTSGDVEGLGRIARRFARRRSRGKSSRPDVWLEPACGTARLLRIAARRGYHGVGFDLSEAMIAYARRLAPPSPAAPLRLFTADMTSFASMLDRRSVHFAFNLINTIRHLPCDAAMLDHFEHMARVLAPGGVYAVGVGLCAYGLEPPTEDVWRGARGRCRVTQVIQYLPPPSRRERWEHVASHITVATPKQTQRFDSAYRLRTYDMDQWLHLVDQSALRGVAWVDEWGGDIIMREPGYGIHILEVR